MEGVEGGVYFKMFSVSVHRLRKGGGIRRCIDRGGSKGKDTVGRERGNARERVTQIRKAHPSVIARKRGKIRKKEVRHRLGK